MYNCHTHTFIFDDIPDKFLPLGLMRLLANDKNFNFIAKILHNIIPFYDKDIFDRYLNFSKTVKNKNQEKVLCELIDLYNLKTKFIILAINLENMKRGKIKRPYYEQLKELSELSKKYKKIIPFVHVDPYTNNYEEIFVDAIEKLNFKGVKLYPALGYFPQDEKLDNIYKYCEKNNLPIISHCANNNVIYTEEKKKNYIKKYIKHFNTKFKSAKELSSAYTNPVNYAEILKKYPKLNICLAHTGGYEEWDKELENKIGWVYVIKELMKQFKNLYCDISYTLHDSKYYPILMNFLSSEVNEQILFGSDYYMNKTKKGEQPFLDIKKYLGKNLFKKISNDNIKKFLGE